MKSQLFIIIFVLVFIFVIIGLFYFISMFNISYIEKYLIPSQKEKSYTMLNALLENYVIEDTNLTIKNALSYIISQKTEIFNGINLTKKIIETFNKILGDRWKILVEEHIIVNAWVVKANFYNAEVWNYDTAIYPDFEDSLGNKWYYKNFNDSTWIYSTIPFYQGTQIEKTLLISKKEDLNNLLPEVFTVKGIYILNSKISPLDFLRRFEACYYPGDKYYPTIKIEKNINNLPKNIDLGEFAYFNFSDDFCNKINNYRELNTSIFEIEKYYSSISNISEILRSLNLNYEIAISYIRGYFYVPEDCEEVYIEAIWNELFRIYINGFFLFATCYNSTLNPPKYKLPLEFCKENQKFSCIKGTPTWGILKANITSYIKKGETNVIAMLFGVPHNENTIPSCFKDIKKYTDISLNTLGSVRIFCINKFGERVELNDKTILPPKTIYSIGYDIPKVLKQYVIQTTLFSKDIETKDISSIYVIKLIYW